MSYTLELDPELDGEFDTEFDTAAELDEFEALDEMDELDELADGEFEQQGLLDEAGEDNEVVRRNRIARAHARARSRSRAKAGQLRRRRRAGSVFAPGGGFGAATCVCPQHGTEFVRWVQSSLNQLQGDGLPVNGVVDGATRAALRRFQAAQQLPVDGIAGPDTEQALLQARRGAAPAAPAQGAEPAATDEFELIEALDAAEEFALDGEFETDPDAHRWPRGRSFNPQNIGSIPSGPYRTGSGLCTGIESDMQDLLLSIEPFSRSVEALQTLTRQKPRNQALIDDTGKKARQQMSNLKINLVKMRDRVKSGHYLSNGCTRQDIAKVTARVRGRTGAWRRIAAIEKLRDELVFWLRKSR